MRIFKALCLYLLFLIFLASGNYGQSATVNEFSITAQRQSSTIPTVAIAMRGSNLEIRGNYNIPATYQFCSPCTPSEELQFSRIFSAINVAPASGTINGVYYQRLYLGYGFNIQQQQDVKIPQNWSKSVRVSTPIKLTGKVGAWLTSMDVGQIERAVFYQENIKLDGRAELALSWVFQNQGNINRRLYFDKFLVYKLTSSAENKEKVETIK